MDKLGVYLSVSLYFVVATLIEFALVLFLKVYSEQRNKKNGSNNKLRPFCSLESIDKFVLAKRTKKASQNETGLKSKELENKKIRNVSLEASLIKIDTYASFIFFTGYILFNFIYWCL